MTPDALNASSFDRYPPQAGQWCIRHLDLLRRLPLVVGPSFLEQAIAYDWKFPVEKRKLSAQATALEALAPEAFVKLIAAFADIAVPAALEHSDWVNQPAQFDELLTTHLWSTRRIDQYRQGAKALLDSVPPVPPDANPGKPRTVIFLAGSELVAPAYPLFTKLRSHGLHAVDVARVDERDWALGLLTRRAAGRNDPYATWYLDGGEAWTLPSNPGGITTLSYSRLTPVRKAVLAKMDHATRTGAGPELLHHQLAAMQPEDCGVRALTPDPVLQHFAVELFTQGSGTQIYSTTFIQWAAREILRRAQPQTLVVKAAARVRQRSLNELIAGGSADPDPDPAGSAIDADMAAYYTWLELQKLPGAAGAVFLAWFQGHGEAFLSGPSVPANVLTKTRMTISQLFDLA